MSVKRITMIFHVYFYFMLCFCSYLKFPLFGHFTFRFPLKGIKIYQQEFLEFNFNLLIVLGSEFSSCCLESPAAKVDQLET